CFLADKVERVHANAPGCPLGLADLLRNICHELASHMLKEEQILFPMLGGGIYPNGPINVMQDEHEEHLQAVEQLRQLTNDITLPAGACNSWKRSEEHTSELQSRENLVCRLLLEKKN